MTATVPVISEVLREAVAREGFAQVPAARMQRLLEQWRDLADWPAFAASWNDLPLDDYMGDQGRYRRRRYAVYDAPATGEITRAPHEAHYQSLDYNRLNGGVARWFAPIDDAIGAGASLVAVLHFARAFFGALSPEVKRWHIEVHQFRIEARVDLAGLPTPEGVHRDGVDWVLVMMVARTNIASGTTTIHDEGGRELGSFTLTHAFDTALVDDHRLYHGVTPVTPVDPALPAYRDVLVVTLRRVD